MKIDEQFERCEPVRVKKRKARTAGGVERTNACDHGFVQKIADGKTSDVYELSRKVKIDDEKRGKKACKHRRITFFLGPPWVLITYQIPGTYHHAPPGKGPDTCVPKGTKHFVPHAVGGATEIRRQRRLRRGGGTPFMSSRA